MLGAVCYIAIVNQIAHVSARETLPLGWLDISLPKEIHQQSKDFPLEKYSEQVIGDI